MTTQRHLILCASISHPLCTTLSYSWLHTKRRVLPQGLSLSRHATASAPPETARLTQQPATSTRLCELTQPWWRGSYHQVLCEPIFIEIQRDPVRLAHPRYQRAHDVRPWRLHIVRGYIGPHLVLGLFHKGLYRSPILFWDCFKKCFFSKFDFVIFHVYAKSLAIFVMYYLWVYFIWFIDIKNMSLNIPVISNFDTWFSGIPFFLNIHNSPRTFLSHILWDIHLSQSKSSFFQNYLKLVVNEYWKSVISCLFIISILFWSCQHAGNWSTKWTHNTWAVQKQTRAYFV